MTTVSKPFDIFGFYLHIHTRFEKKWNREKFHQFWVESKKKLVRFSKEFFSKKVFIQEMNFDLAT